MSASPRDLLKPRAQRLLEVAQGIQQQTGFADSQYVTFGCKLAPGSTAANLAVSDGEYSLAQSLVQYAGTAAAGVSIASGQAIWNGQTPTNTAAGQLCIVLIEADASGTLYATQGAIANSGTPVAPSPTANRIVLGYLSVPASFTFGTTALTAGGTSLNPTGGICVTQSYDKGNVNPSGTQSPAGSSGGF